MDEITVPATDISQKPYRNATLHISVMRTCTFLAIRQGGQPAGHYDISRADWERITSVPAPGSEPADGPAARVRELERTIELLLAYGTARFGDEWWPGNARQHMPDGRELEYLLDPGSAEQADQAVRSGVDRHYVGGWPEFRRTEQASYCAPRKSALLPGTDHMRGEGQNMELLTREENARRHGTGQERTP
jgi:hypothetical protein